MTDFDWIMLLLFVAFTMYQWYKEARDVKRFETLELHEKITDMDLIQHRQELNSLHRFQQEMDRKLKDVDPIEHF